MLNTHMHTQRDENMNCVLILVETEGWVRLHPHKAPDLNGVKKREGKRGALNL